MKSARAYEIAQIERRIAELQQRAERLRAETDNVRAGPVRLCAAHVEPEIDGDRIVVTGRASFIADYSTKTELSVLFGEESIARYLLPRLDELHDVSQLEMRLVGELAVPGVMGQRAAKMLLRGKAGT